MHLPMHQVQAVLKLGDLLKPGIHIHHSDGIKHNAIFSNLIVTTVAKHSKWGSVKKLKGKKRDDYVEEIKAIKAKHKEIYNDEFFAILLMTHTPNEIQCFCDLFVDLTGYAQLVLACYPEIKRMYDHIIELT